MISDRADDAPHLDFIIDFSREKTSRLESRRFIAWPVKLKSLLS